MFLPNGEVVQPAEALYGHPVILLRGSFAPVMNVHLEMLRQAHDGFDRSLDEVDRGQAIELCEISMQNLLRGRRVDPVDFLDRADALQALGKTVLLSRCAEFHRLTAFIHRYTKKPIGIILSIGLLNELFKSKWSENLAGGLLESFGRLFKVGVTLYVFPWKNRHSSELVTAENFLAPIDCAHLYQHFLVNNRIQSIACTDEQLLTATGRDVYRMIHSGDSQWQDFVPEVAWKLAERNAAHDPS
jgi:hypothetical protein